MADNFEDQFGTAFEDEKRRWYAARNRAVANAKNAYERGRQAYGDAIRTGRDVVARTPQEVRALGEAAKTGLRAGNAGARAAGNAISLGYADNLEAGSEAAFGLGGTGGFGERYQKRLALQHQADAQAAQEFPGIYKWSGRAGAVGGILAADTPAMAGAVKAIPGMAKAFKAIQGAKRFGFVQEGLPTMAAVGGGIVGGATQVAGDALQGKSTSVRDFTGAVGGGALGGLQAVRGGPVLGAALGGGATGLFQGDGLDGSLRDATGSAYAGRVLGTMAEQAANALPNAMKGKLGEGLSFAKSWARGESIPFKATPTDTVKYNIPAPGTSAGPQEWVRLLNGRQSRPDFLTDWGRALEAKFGNSASLTKNQKQLIPLLGDDFRVDHWLPRDIGDFSGGWFGSPFRLAARKGDDSQ